ncbi:hypothetical protein B0G73_10683 [Paraburkholderia sp. BL25I1N1]|nr:hypothetical protein B0G73_10683 [Paraburkholderia sp. BL25I1N1]
MVRAMPLHEAFDTRRDPFGFAQHDPMAGIDLIALIRAEPALQPKRERRADVPVTQRHDELHRRVRMTRARAQQLVDEIGAVHSGR